MLQANLLLAMGGRKPDSFVMLDLMRLPLGILCGIGFIGAGAILRRGDMVHGVTTAATLWFVTVMGLCFGGGQLGLGLAVLAIGLFVLVMLKWFEDRIRSEHHATLVLSCQPNGPDDTRSPGLRCWQPDFGSFPSASHTPSRPSAASFGLS